MNFCPRCGAPVVGAFWKNCDAPTVIVDGVLIGDDAMIAHSLEALHRRALPF
ncbi:MAG TPA: hypothetical protein VII65_07255 [Acidimicrobiales bacterium]